MYRSINVRPMSLPLDNSMSRGSWNNGGECYTGVLPTGTRNTGHQRNHNYNHKYRCAAACRPAFTFQVWMAGSIGVNDFWGNGNKVELRQTLPETAHYTTSFRSFQRADTICLVLNSDIDIFKYASKDSRGIRSIPASDEDRKRYEGPGAEKPISLHRSPDVAYRLGTTAAQACATTF